MVERKETYHLAKRALELTNEQRTLLIQLLRNRRKLRNERALLHENMDVLLSLKKQLSDILNRYGSS